MLRFDKTLPFTAIVAIYVLLIAVIFFLTPVTGQLFDTSCWINWSSYAFNHGLSDVYESGTDYLPLYHYILYLYGLLQGSEPKIAENIYFLKLVTLCFEAGSALLLYYVLNEKYKNPWKALLLSLFYFLNFAVLYNSIIWGQVDGILTFFVFASVIAGMKRKLFLSLLMFLFALNMKIQAIIFLPLVAALILPLIVEFRSGRILLYISALVTIQTLIVLPFALNGDIRSVWNTVYGSVNRYPIVSMNAYNIWYLFVDGVLSATSDGILFAGLTYLRWGQLMFFIAGFISLAWLLKPIYQSVIKKIEFDISPERVFVTGALIALIFFYFNTQMHERYSHPAFIFLAAAGLYTGRAIPYILASFAYYLNLEDLLRYFKTGNYHTLIFTPEFIAITYGLVIILLFIELYRKPRGKKDYILLNF